MSRTQQFWTFVFFSHTHNVVQPLDDWKRSKGLAAGEDGPARIYDRSTGVFQTDFIFFFLGGKKDKIEKTRSLKIWRKN